MSKSVFAKSRWLASAVTLAFVATGLVYTAPAQAAFAPDCTKSISGAATAVMSGAALQVGNQSCQAGNDIIYITGSSGADILTFDLSGGSFTDQGSALWIQVDLAGGTDTIIVKGTDNADKVTIGAKGINLDAQGDLEVTNQVAADSSKEDIKGMNTESFTINGLGGNDFELASGELAGGAMPLPVTLNGFDGTNTATSATDKDFLVGGSANDTLNGDDDSDTLEGGLANDLENGGLGGDTFVADHLPSGGEVANPGQTTNVTVPGPVDGNDTMNGGDGRDTIQYNRRTKDLSITVAGLTDASGNQINSSAWSAGNDGWPAGGEADNVINFEQIFGGFGNDAISTAAYTGATAPKVTIYGGGGNDSVTGGDANDTFYGDDGTDTLNGGPGDDKFNGGKGNDTENGNNGADKFLENSAGDGNDTMNGGTSSTGGAPDVDVVTYSARSNKLTVTIGSGANDGEATETDNVGADIEKVVGGRNDDTLTGSTGDETILGGEGDDTIKGLGGNDTLKGGDGSDAIGDNASETGDDSLYGQSGGDQLNGGPGSDYINGGGGRNFCKDPDGATKVNC